MPRSVVVNSVFYAYQWNTALVHLLQSQKPQRSGADSNLKSIRVTIGSSVPCHLHHMRHRDIRCVTGWGHIYEVFLPCILLEIPILMRDSSLLLKQNIAYAHRRSQRIAGGVAPPRHYHRRIRSLHSRTKTHHFGLVLRVLRFQATCRHHLIFLGDLCSHLCPYYYSDPTAI